MMRRIMMIRSLLLRATGALLVVFGVAFVRAHLRARSAAPVATASAPCEAGSSHACAAPEVGEVRGDVALPPGSPRLVEFESAYCTVCERMAPLVREIEQRCSREPGDILRIRVDDERGQALAARYGVRLLPTFLGVDAEGQEVERAVGELDRERLASLFGDVRGERCPPVL
jgi:cytochrome c-type biogenesis protein